MSKFKRKEYNTIQNGKNKYKKYITAYRICTVKCRIFKILYKMKNTQLILKINRKNNFRIQGILPIMQNIS